METIVLFNVASDTAKILNESPAFSRETFFDGAPDTATLYTYMAKSFAHVLTLVIGAEGCDPVSIAQRSQMLDKDVEVCILSKPDTCEDLARSLQFLPFIGRTVTCLPTGEPRALIDALQAAVARTRQRRHHKAVVRSMQAQLHAASPYLPRLSQAFDHLLNLIPIGVLMLDRDGRVLEGNQQAGDILCKEEPDVIGVSFVDLFPIKLQIELAECITHCIELGAPSPPLLIERIKLGEVQYIELILTGITDQDQQPGVLVLIQDITKRKRAEQAQVLIETAGAAAHEINQPLQAIVGITELMMWQMKDEKYREDLEILHAAGKRIGEIVEKMREIRQYITKPYVDDVRIVDFDLSTQDRQP